ILVAGSTLVATSEHAILFMEFTLGANSTLLLLDNRIEGNRYAVYFPVAVVVDGGGIIVNGNVLSTTDNRCRMGSAVCLHAVDVRNGGYFDIENNTMRAAIGIELFLHATVSSAGLLRVADCTFVGRKESFDSTLVFLDGSVTLEGGAQWRVEGNKVSAASVIGVTKSWHKMRLSGSSTTVVLSNNRQVDDSYSFADLALPSMVKKPPRGSWLGATCRAMRRCRTPVCF
ncbi:dispersed gene family protein 1 (DGF-1), putative, partial [Trypanosoma cruzi]